MTFYSGKPSIPPPMDDVPTAVPTVTSADHHVCPSCTTVHPQTKVLTIDVTIDPTAVLRYVVPEHMQESIGKTFGHLSFIDSPLVAIPHGTYVSHGSNEYIVVEHFVNKEEKEALPETNNALIVKNVPAGTKILDANGMAVSTAAPITVEVPGASLMRLPAGTKLQQVDGPIKLQLVESVTVRLD